MEITKENKKYVRNLARCRSSYKFYLSKEQIDLLLENRMVEIQNFLAELGIDWEDYSGKLE